MTDRFAGLTAFEVANQGNDLRALFSLTTVNRHRCLQRSWLSLSVYLIWRIVGSDEIEEVIARVIDVSLGSARVG